MKKIILSVIFALICTLSFAQKGFEAKFSQPSSTEYQVSFSVTNWNIETVQFDGVNFQQIVFSSSTVTQEKGWAELPFISAAIQLPAKKNVDVEVVYSDYTDYTLSFPLVPSRGTIIRNQDPTTIPYEIAPESMIDKFYPGNLATADEPYIIRDVRGTSVRVFPFQYNAVTNTLRVYNKMDVLLTENNQPATNPLMKENLSPVKEMIGMYQSLFLNFDVTRYDLPMAQYGEILVITTPRDQETIDSYIQWKKEKGFIVHKEIVATGTNVKSLIQQKYNENNNILYVQLVGDWADIKSDLGGGESAPTDPKMGCVVGTDNFPDISVGRFSCSNADQLNIQINKAIQYEKNPSMEGWYSSFIGMGSNDTGPADDGEKDWLHIQRIYSQRLEPTYNYNTHYRLYENETGCTAANLSNYINTGASTIAYCGHGSATSFVTTGFSNSHITNLTNGEKLPFIVSVACVNGAFHNSSDCFAEAWLKKQNGGAVVTWMSTINQPWAEPMRGQDYFYDVLCGGFNYANYPGQNGISTTELRTTWGSIVVNAGNLMLTESQGSGDVNTLHTWTTFGDASLQLRTMPPAVLASSMPTILVGMPYSTTITANGNPVKDALVCISQNGVYYSAITDEDGNVTIDNDFLPGDVLLVVTAFNTNTIYENIDCIPADGAYIIYDSYLPADGNALTYISTNADITVTLKNVGTDPTTGTITVTLACEDPLLTINNPTGQITVPIAAGGTATVTFNVTVDNSIPDNKTFPVNIAVSGAKTLWESKMNLKAYAPVFTLDKVLVDGVENGSLTKGTVATITTVVKNTGHAEAFGVKGNLTVNSPYVTLACEEKNRAGQNLIAGETIEFPFTVITDAGMPFGHTANMDLLITAQYGRAETEDFTVSNAGSDSYCTPGSTNCASGAGDKFTSVVIIKNSDQTELLNNPSTTCTTGGYQNFTNMSFTLEPGQQYTIKVKCAYGSDYVRGWFDLNGNNIFDSNEQLIQVSCPVANAEYTTTFSVPQEATPGEHRFRLRVNWNTYPPNACDAYTYGQTHDYTFVIPEIYARPQNVVAVLNGETITTTWEAPADGTPDGYNIYRSGTKLNSTLLTTTTYTEENIEEGVYVYNVTAVYSGNKESYAEMSNVICNFTPCIQPTNVAGFAEGKNAIITWGVSEEIEGLVYNIYRNGTKINGEFLTEREYVDENLAAGTYSYQISVVNQNCISELSDPVLVTIDPEFCEPPANLSYLITDDYTVTLTWDEPEEIDGELLGYNVYRDEEQINEDPIIETEYTDEDLDDGKYTYQVSAVYGHCESEKIVKIITVSINDFKALSYSIFPNPTNGEVTIEGKELNRVEIYDLQGRKLAEHKVINEKLEINVNKYEDGIYFVRLYSDNSDVVVKRLVIIK
ncbi:MAG: C25 family cysteine peptidase [Bacteroidales bacterium]|jgi:hypothetical protein|nr:C25 family cysteine peptidase [Bacteroidales bacterium]